MEIMGSMIQKKAGWLSQVQRDGQGEEGPKSPRYAKCQVTKM